MFCLRQQVGRNPLRVRSLVRDHDDLGRPGNRVDAHGSKNLALGLRNIGVAGAYDLGDGLDCLRTVGERGDGLRPAYAVDFGDTREMGGG